MTDINWLLLSGFALWFFLGYMAGWNRKLNHMEGLAQKFVKQIEQQSNEICEYQMKEMRAKQSPQHKE